MYSVWRTSLHQRLDGRAPQRGQSGARQPAQALHHLSPILADSTFINDTIRCEHSPPVGDEAH